METKTWNGEPALLKAAIVSVLATVASLVAGQTTSVDGANAIWTSVGSFVIPLVLGYWTRKSVSPVTAVDTQSDAK